MTHTFAAKQFNISPHRYESKHSILIAEAIQWQQQQCKTNNECDKCATHESESEEFKMINYFNGNSNERTMMQSVQQSECSNDLALILLPNRVVMYLNFIHFYMDCVTMHTRTYFRVLTSFYRRLFHTNSDVTHTHTRNKTRIETHLYRFFDLKTKFDVFVFFFFVFFSPFVWTEYWPHFKW